MDRNPTPPPGQHLYHSIDVPDDVILKSPQTRLRIVSWNIERGYRPDDLVQTLQRLQPIDILLLQEVDNGCIRTQRLDVGEYIGQKLGLGHYLYATEFVELESPLRTPELQGGGVHGNAILSRHPFLPIDDFRSSELPLQEGAELRVYESAQGFSFQHRRQPYDWSHSKEEPREGARVALGAIISSPIGPVAAYSVHFENNDIILGRMEQLKEVLLHSQSLDVSMKVIAGDFNTLSHGLARFRMLPRNCAQLSELWQSWGLSEAEWWQKKIFDVPVDSKDENNHKGKSPLQRPDDESSVFRYAQEFFDPWDKKKGITCTHLDGWYQAKLDWMLLSHFSVTHYELDGKIDGPIGVRASDHKLLFAQVAVES